MKPITIEFALTLTLLWMYLANTEAGLSNEIASCFKLRVKKRASVEALLRCVHCTYFRAWLAVNYSVNLVFE